MRVVCLCLFATGVRAVVVRDQRQRGGRGAKAAAVIVPRGATGPGERLRGSETGSRKGLASKGRRQSSRKDVGVVGGPRGAHRDGACAAGGDAYRFHCLNWRGALPACGCDILLADASPLMSRQTARETPQPGSAWAKAIKKRARRVAGERREGAGGRETQALAGRVRQSNKAACLHRPGKGTLVVSTLFVRGRRMRP